VALAGRDSLLDRAEESANVARDRPPPSHATEIPLERELIPTSTLFFGMSSLGVRLKPSAFGLSLLLQTTVLGFDARPLLGFALETPSLCFGFKHDDDAAEVGLERVLPVRPGVSRAADAADGKLQASAGEVLEHRPGRLLLAVILAMKSAPIESAGKRRNHPSPPSRPAPPSSPQIPVVLLLQPSRRRLAAPSRLECPTLLEPLRKRDSSPVLPLAAGTE
jgi:hypothetical protein